MPALDGVRGVAILLVFLAHTHPKLLEGGFIGVDLFFVLSGFLITGILLNEHAEAGRISLRRFYVRRALRLLPALFAMVAAVTLFAWRFQPEQFWITVEDARAIIFYYWNWVLYLHYGEHGWTYQWVFGHLWSLSVEEQFYILWPIVLLLVLAARRHWVTAAVLALGIIGPALGRLAAWDPQYTFNLYFRTDLHFDGLMWGALGAVIVSGRFMPRDITESRALRIAGPVCLAAFIGAAYFELFWSGIAFLGGWTLLDALAMISIVSLASRPLPIFRRLMEFRPLCWTGRISYGLYIWHLPVFFHCRKLPVDPTWQSIAAIAISYLIASVSFYGMERYFLRLKDRFASKTVEIRTNRSTVQRA